MVKNMVLMIFTSISVDYIVVEALHDRTAMDMQFVT